jgi:hypothetical protein
MGKGAAGVRSEEGGTTCRPCIRHDGEVMDESFVARRGWALRIDGLEDGPQDR